MSSFFVLEEEQLTRLEAVAKRLFTEDRMNADEMRDAAQTIAGVVRRARQWELPEPKETP